jgi:hypothetical protein
VKSRSIRTLAPALILIGATLAAPAASASTPTRQRVFAPTSRSDAGALVFHLRGVTPRSVRRGYLNVRGRHHALRTETLRAGARHGRLKVPVPDGARAFSRRKTESSAGTRARLVVVVRGGPRKPAGCTSSGVARGLGGFGVGAWPGGCWRPYADDSPFNSRFSSSPRLDPRSDAIVQRLTGWGAPVELRAGISDTASDWQHPTYYSRASDPMFTIHCTESWGDCEVEGMQVRIPDQARAAGGHDAHMTVVDQASGWEYDLWQVTGKPRGGGRLLTSWGGRTRIDGDGLGSDATAAHFGLLAGSIRAEEMERGRIDHALFMLVRCDSAKIVFPAQGHGAACSDRRDAPAEGARFRLDLSNAQIAALKAPDWKKTILRAMSEYGLYVGDTTGGTPWNIWFESGSTYTSFGKVDPMITFARQAGIPRSSDGRYYFDWGSGIDWRHHLQVVDPSESQRLS